MELSETTQITPDGRLVWRYPFAPSGAYIDGITEDYWTGEKRYHFTAERYTPEPARKDADK